MTTPAAVVVPSRMDHGSKFTRLTLPITLFSIPLGLAGLGAAWTAAADVLGAPSLPGDLAYGAG